MASGSSGFGGLWGGRAFRGTEHPAGQKLGVLIVSCAEIQLQEELPVPLKRPLDSTYGLGGDRQVSVIPSVVQVVVPEQHGDPPSRVGDQVAVHLEAVVHGCCDGDEGEVVPDSHLKIGLKSQARHEFSEVELHAGDDLVWIVGHSDAWAEAIVAEALG